MDRAAPVIQRVLTPEYGRVIVDASDGKRYHADLGALSAAYCFPRTPERWADVAPDGYGSSLVWACRFEVHVDQIIGLADRIEPMLRSA